MEASAIAECRLVRSIEGSVAPDVVAALVSACTPALSSPTVAEEFVTTIGTICEESVKNRVVCAAAGVIPLLVRVLSTHGDESVDIAARGCGALGMVAIENTANADAIVLSTGGLAAICSLLSTHAASLGLQVEACWAVWFLANAAGPAALTAMREGTVVELLLAAKRNHPSQPGPTSDKHFTDLPLALLTAA